MKHENKLEIIQILQDLCNATHALDDLIITPGYLDYTTGEFVPSTEEEKMKHLCFTWKEQLYQFGKICSIEADSGYGIICDAMKIITKIA